MTKKQKLGSVSDTGEKTEGRPGNSDVEVMAGPSKETEKVAPKSGKTENGEKSESTLYDKLIGKYTEPEKNGPKVNPKLAELVKDILKSKLTDKKKSEIIERNLKPENCDLLTVPRVNKEVWNIMFSSKQKDLLLQKDQKTLIAAIIPIVYSVEKLISADEKQSRPDIDEIVNDLRDAVTLLTNTSQEMSYKRRDNIRKDIGDKYKAMCSRSTEITENLFGDNVEEQMKTIDKTSNLGKSMS